MGKEIILIFDSTHGTLQAERILKENKIRNRIVPKPREISASCGVGLIVFEKDVVEAVKLLESQKIPPVKLYIRTGDNLEEFDLHRGR